MCRASSTPIKLAVLGILAGLFSSCVPVVNHGPRVTPGWTGGVSGSMALGPRYGSDDGPQPFLYGPFGVNLAHGWRSDEDNKGAIQFGAHLPASMALAPFAVVEMTQLDLYYELPKTRTGSLSAGLGVNGSSAHLMPYFQLGKIGPNDSGWYTTQGLARFWSDGVFTTTWSAIAWLPTIAYQAGGRRVNSHWFVIGAVGKRFHKCYPGTTCSPTGEPRYLVTAGVTFQFHRPR